ncbi:hypothetical protein OGAPHI_000432 [Ogataea philodendri]|uniref:RING-type domain-containing protein n=1 Tax=Ogataea philodendri TaxID=1378263 RepID=A0A9P8PI74_9ASCO|nr:uncharacterized protein OGAPHI_000432 [Ogataea philodendri]KAH3671727.1 hypothetical protein OGAPHI_000432 [Ogataea philodendri]
MSLIGCQLDEPQFVVNQLPTLVKFLNAVKNDPSLIQKKATSKKRTIADILREHHEYYGIRPKKELVSDTVRIDLAERYMFLAESTLLGEFSKIIDSDNFNRLQSLYHSDQDPVELPQFEVGLKLQDQVVEVWTNPKGKHKSLLLFKLQVDRQYLPFLSAQLNLAKKAHKLDTIKLDKPALNLTLSLDRQINKLTLEFRIAFKIELKEVVDYKYPLDTIKKIKEVSLFVFTPELTDYQMAHSSKSFPKPSESSFYDLVTSNTEKLKYGDTQIKISSIRKTLMKFQQQTLQWMLNHEGVRFIEGTDTIERVPDQAYDAKNLDLISESLDLVTFGWSCVQSLASGNYYWYNSYTGNICSTQTAIDYLTQFNRYPKHAKALLSEEMGLGKTVEVISLISVNPRPEPFGIQKMDIFNGGRIVTESKTTLIICPQSIIGQWRQEIEDVSSSLKIMVYEGIYNYEKEAESSNSTLTPSDMAAKIREHDIVLVSYHTVSRELHRAIFKPVSRPTRKCAKRLKLNSGVMELKEESAVKVEQDDFDFEHTEYERIDYSSPLMLVEFWRVVLDEVQMTASMTANASKFARIIPRVHSWGVSGTLIKNNLNDLHSLLSFLRLNPIDLYSGTSGISPWVSIVTEAPYYQFQRLFSKICLRHTKKMVADQIKLPQQTRILLRMPFTAIERDNYDNLFSNFLRQVGLNEQGEPVVEDYEPAKYYTYMRQWLIRLRQVCCHAQLGTGPGSRRRFGGIFFGDDNGQDKFGMILGTLDDVLANLKKVTFDDCISGERNIYGLQLRRGKIYEFLRLPQESLKIFEEIMADIEAKVEELRNAGEENLPKLRSWLELLYQTYFLYASAHYQHYRPMRPMPTGFDEKGHIPEDDEEVLKPVEEVDVDTLTPNEKKHYEIENEYYRRADDLLTQILQDPISKVNEAIAKLVERFGSIESYKFPTSSVKKNNSELLKEAGIESSVNLWRACIPFDVDVKENYAHSIQAQMIFERLVKTKADINLQGHMINTWVAKLVELLKEPVVKDEEIQNTGEEYGVSLINQELAHTYLEELQLILEDRENAMISTDDSAQKKSKSSKEKVLVNVNQPTNYDLHVHLDKIRRKVIPEGCYNAKFCLRAILVEFQNLVADLARHDEQGNAKSSDYEFMSSVASDVKKEFDLQRVNINQLRTKLFDTLNDTFNAKISYFKSLQIKSDIVANYLPVRPAFSPEMTPNEKAQQDLHTLQMEIKSLEDSVRSSKVRLTYLNSLIGDTGGDEDLETKKEKTCVICRSSIVLGTLTSCGHQFCKDCLGEWMGVHPTCPMCKKRLFASDLYSFTLTRKELKGGMISESQDPPDSKSSAEVDRDLSKLYKSLNPAMLKEISSIELKKNYGSKVDMIVRQILYLKQMEQDVQIIVYSQWTEFLKFLGRALRQNGISFLSSSDVAHENPNTKRGRTTFGSKEIEKFKKDPRITCFLLNAKAQAAGLTLTNASHVFLCEPLVNLPLELQAISRIHRIGQLKETKVWNFVIENSVEESIAILSTAKRMELVRKRTASQSNIDEVDDDLVDSTELTKTLNGLVDKKVSGGEVVSNDELWASFFASKSGTVMDSVVA